MKDALLEITLQLIKWSLLPQSKTLKKPKADTSQSLTQVLDHVRLEIHCDLILVQCTLAEEPSLTVLA